MYTTALLRYRIYNTRRRHGVDTELYRGRPTESARRGTNKYTTMVEEFCALRDPIQYSILTAVIARVEVSETNTNRGNLVIITRKQGCQF